MSLTRRSLLSVFTLTGAGGFLVGDTASAVAEAAKTGGTQVRIGKVVSVNGSTLTVSVGGGTLVDMPYLLGLQLVPGDSVATVQAGPTWYVIGPFAGVPTDNLVVNGSFETSAGVPSTAGWDFQVLQNTAGTPAWSVNDAGTFAVGDYVSGLKAAYIDCSTTGVGSDCEGKLRSSPIPVLQSEQYAGAASVAANIPPPLRYKVVGTNAVLPLAQVDVALEFYVNAGDTTSASFVDYGPVPPTPFAYRLMRTPLTSVPAGVNFMRLTLDFLAHDTDVNSYVAVFDRAIVRKIRNADGSLAF